MTIGFAIALIAISFLHFSIFVIEAFFWNKRLGIKSFNLTKSFADQTKVMAVNQGFYNAFLASGLLLSMLFKQTGPAIFVLCCVFIAGIVGGITSNKKILLIQSVPALIALVLFFYKI
jgi:Predicted membrane protein